MRPLAAAVGARHRVELVEERAGEPPDRLLTALQLVVEIEHRRDEAGPQLERRAPDAARRGGPRAAAACASMRSRARRVSSGGRVGQRRAQAIEPVLACRRGRAATARRRRSGSRALSSVWRSSSAAARVGTMTTRRRAASGGPASARVTRALAKCGEIARADQRATLHGRARVDHWIFGGTGARPADPARGRSSSSAPAAAVDASRCRFPRSSSSPRAATGARPRRPCAARSRAWRAHRRDRRRLDRREIRGESPTRARGAHEPVVGRELAVADVT